MSTLSDVISKATDRVRDYHDRRVRLTESDTIRVLILPVLEALSWDLQDVEEVRSEYRHASADNPVDYALFLHATPKLFVEAKALARRPSGWTSVFWGERPVRIGMLTEDAAMLVRPALETGIALRIRIVELHPTYLTPERRARISVSVWGAVAQITPPNGFSRVRSA